MNLFKKIMKKITTNVTKILDKHKINYELKEYEANNRLSGKEIALILNEEPSLCYKTLLTRTSKSPYKYYIFSLEVDKELDLKKCAKLKGEKSIEIAHEKEMKPITGYVHGGCSIIGLLKLNIEITVNSNFFNHDFIYISAGEVGKQIKINPNDLKSFLKINIGDISK